MQQRDHRQLDLFGGNRHPHGPQLAIVMAAVMRGAWSLQSLPSVHRIEDLLINAGLAELSAYYRVEGAC
ncbi:hypothetical protein [Ralstonia pseudosolanacearum]|uniref:hypothetical protein n=1 Tax=Ralstonia pseudosolanacearum TaxID=1310165 RepID=UPI001FFBCAB8|nr:hypothetical protein [Ralstonia pseudosolanacearum]